MQTCASRFERFDENTFDPTKPERVYCSQCVSNYRCSCVVGQLNSLSPELFKAGLRKPARRGIDEESSSDEIRPNPDSQKLSPRYQRELVRKYWNRGKDTLEQMEMRPIVGLVGERMRAAMGKVRMPATRPMHQDLQSMMEIVTHQQRKDDIRSRFPPMPTGSVAMLTGPLAKVAMRTCA